MKYLLAAIIACLFFCGCSTTTEIYVYDDKGLENKIAKVRQTRDGMAMYEMKDKKIVIKVDTRHKNWFERNIMPLFQYGARQMVW